MSSPRQTVPPPALATPVGEPNRFVAGFKRSLVRRWSHTRVAELYEEADLAVFLWALSRDEEALEILRSITTAVPVPPPFGPDGMPTMAVWSPMSTMHAMEARLLRRADRRQESAAAAARLLRHPGIADNRELIVGTVLRAPVTFQEAEAERSDRWACTTISRRTGALVHLRELAIAGHRLGWHVDPEHTETQIIAGRTHLAARLAAAG